MQGTHAESTWQLQVKLLEGAASGPSVASFLGRAVEPPVEAAVKNALRLLEDIGAIQEGTEALTKLGRHLAALPLPPRVGKMLHGLQVGIYSCIHSFIHPSIHSFIQSFIHSFMRSF